MAYMRLGDLLVSSGVITEAQLEQALAMPKESGQRLGDVLIQSGLITEAQLIDALRVQLGVDFVDLTAVSIPVELAQYVPRNLAKKFCVVPVKLMQDRLFLAMSDPLDFVAQDEVKTASRKRIVPMIATRKAAEQAIERLYGSEGTARVIEEMKREAGGSENIIPAQMAHDATDPDESAPTIRFVNSLIERAFSQRASDIHLEPQDGEMVVRMRIDGLLQRMLTVPADLQNTVLSRLKIMGGMNIAEHKIPQDGHALVPVRGHSLDLRISSMPTVYGKKIVLRLLDKSAQALDRSALGLEGRDLDNYNALLKNTSGVILLVGPTGSGKSTTMSNMLRDLSRDEINIVTLEECFRRLHQYYDRSAKTKAKVVSTLTYPAMVIVVAIIVFVIIIAVAVPAFTRTFEEMGAGSLPGITRALMAVSGFFTQWWWLVLALLALLAAAYLTARRTDRGRAALASWSLTKAPLHRLHAMSAAGQFAHSLATMLAAGLPVPRALEVTGQVIGNYTFSLAVQQVKQNVERGRTIAESMGEIDYFPKMLTEMVGM